jgi:hypothetical protein
MTFTVRAFYDMDFNNAGRKRFSTPLEHPGFDLLLFHLKHHFQREVPMAKSMFSVKRDDGTAG